jgi:hypothetical protein
LNLGRVNFNMEEVSSQLAATWEARTATRTAETSAGAAAWAGGTGRGRPGLRHGRPVPRCERPQGGLGPQGGRPGQQLRGSGIPRAMQG